MNELTDGDVEILKLVSESLALNKRFEKLNKKGGEINEQFTTNKIK